MNSTNAVAVNIHALFPESTVAVAVSCACKKTLLMPQIANEIRVLFLVLFVFMRHWISRFNANYE
jgi:hypothetical protein